ncbi:hypothetical protein CGRA01v4_13483 [Colletotrichum graminicola]|nr:hypothetical protein CGRA01v4_13483 [Colletotrichum graminicola]
MSLLTGTHVGQYINQAATYNWASRLDCTSPRYPPAVNRTGRHEMQCSIRQPPSRGRNRASRQAHTGLAGVPYHLCPFRTGALSNMFTRDIPNANSEVNNGRKPRRMRLRSEGSVETDQI